MMHSRHYHIRRLHDIFHAIVLPSLVLSSLLKILGYPPARTALPVHASFVISWAIARGLYSNFVHLSQARRLDAKFIPCVVGKWPGNLDILLNMMRAFNTSYILDVYLNLFEEYQCTTLNLRILWVDHVCLFSLHSVGVIDSLPLPPICRLMQCLYSGFIANSFGIFRGFLADNHSLHTNGEIINASYRSYPWTRNTRNLLLRLASSIFGKVLPKRKECTYDWAHSLQTSESIFLRETFLGGGIFNRDDQVCFPR
jgi:hypothetical protein